MEWLISALFAFFHSAYFPYVIAFILGWLGLGQPKWMVTVRNLLLGIRNQAENLDVIINTIDAIIKANGVVPADAPRLTAKEVQAVLDGNINVDVLAKAQRARLTAKRSAE
jgi:hypothetical protein